MPWDFALIFFVLAVVLPWKGHVRMRKMLAMPQISSLDRLTLYASTIAFQSAATSIVAWRSWARGLSAADLGFLLPDRTRVLLSAIIGGLLLFFLQWMNMRRMSRLPAESRGSLQLLAERILPRSPLESLVFIALCVTAALCEEFVYRGFAMAALTRWEWPSVTVVLATSVLFALGHLYQGRRGVATTLLIGLLFAWARVTCQSLLPLVLWHGGIDLAAGLAGQRYFKEKKGIG